MFFYSLNDFISNPAIIFKIQNGGMSFHGGLLGVIISMILFNRKYKRDFFITMDFVAPLVPLGLGFGRIGNFINGELWGKVSSSSYAMFIPQENISRYPTQLYEAFGGINSFCNTVVIQFKREAKNVNFSFFSNILWFI